MKIEIKNLPQRGVEPRTVTVQETETEEGKLKKGAAHLLDVGDSVEVEIKGSKEVIVYGQG